MEDIIRIGIDHGYGNIKTAHTIFRTGITAYDTEPTFTSSLVEYNDKYYIIGEEHKEFIPEKIWDEDYYLLTLAAIAKELEIRKHRNASIIIAAGLPLKWVRSQRASFTNYLSKHKNISYKYNGKRYQVKIEGVEIYPQGFSAIAEKISDYQGVNMLVDIGNGTMNVMYIIDGRPIENKCYTDKYGASQCIIEMNNELMDRFGSIVDISIVEKVLCKGTAEISERYLKVIQETGRQYAKRIFRKLREYGYNPELMKLHVVGGGGCIIKHFGDNDFLKHDNADHNKNTILIIDDICATAKGYEYLSNQMALRKNRKP